MKTYLIDHGVMESAVERLLGPVLDLRWRWHYFSSGVRNLIRWAPIVWHDGDGDWDSLVDIMEQKLRWMADFHERSEIQSINTPRDIRNMRTAAELCRRLLADDHFDNAGYRPETWDSLPGDKQMRIAKHSHHMAARDCEYLGEIIGKHLRRWWV